jgi:hypothetical protein
MSSECSQLYIHLFLLCLFAYLHLHDQTEMGTRNHDVVPKDLIARIAKLRSGGVHHILRDLTKTKLLAWDNTKCTLTCRSGRCVIMKLIM